MYFHDQTDLVIIIEFWDICFGVWEGHHFRFISHHKVEWRILLNGVGSLIVGEFSSGKEAFQIFRVVGTEHVEVDLHFLVYPLCFSIGLRVVSSAHGQFNAEYSPEFLE